MDANKVLNTLLQFYIKIWTSHWKYRGVDKVAYHEALGDFYKELQDFIDEFAETTLTNDSTMKSLLPININEKEEYSTDAIREMIKNMRTMIITNIKNSLLDDWKGRFVTRLTHYLFMFSVDGKSTLLFSNKNNDLFAGLRKLFHNQSEFVTIYNAWLKGKKVNPKIEAFFKENDSELQGISDTILTTNQELFSIRESFETFDSNIRIQYDNWVKFFDIFVI